MQVNYPSPIYSLIVCDEYIVISCGLGGKKYGQPNKIASYLKNNLTNIISELVIGEEFAENLNYYQKLKIIGGSIENFGVLYSFNYGKVEEILRFQSDSYDMQNVLAFNEEGNYLATGGEDSTLRIWEYQNKKIIKLKETCIHSSQINDVTFYENLVISVSDDNTCKIYDFQKDLLKKVLTLSNFKIAFCKVQKQQKLLYLLRYDIKENSYFSVFDFTQDLVQTKNIYLHNSPVSRICMSQNNIYMGVGFSDGKKHYKICQSQNSHGMIIKGIGFTKNDLLLVSGSPEYKVDFMDYRKRQHSFLKQAIIILIISFIAYIVFQTK